MDNFKRIREVIHKYYPPGSRAHTIYMAHSTAVAKAAQRIASEHPEYNADPEKLEMCCMLHDIGIFYTNAPEIECHGSLRYIEHGYKGRELLEMEGLQDIAPVCERHIGVGLTVDDIIHFKLPLPLRDMTPQTTEEKITCYADKFFSKTAADPEQPKKLEKVMKNIGKYGQDKLERFEEMRRMFGTRAIYGAGAE
jgi:uncharacterized protein